ncbi:MAG: N-acetylmuramoyl-L-alanine amidase [Prevotella sp.]|nr:N-acetylmuramoyl-L-alanine amidase [Prevotella sp.]
MATIVIDAGHGGYDAGAVNGSRYEKNDNLRMALAVGERLERCGINVIYTRTDDTFIPLLERSRISNSNNVDLFASFHRNSSTNSAANGVETIVYNNASTKSVQAAEALQQALVNLGVQSDRGVKRANLSVLRETNAPALLLELGFISNDQDNALFDRQFDAYADTIARSLAQSVGVNCNPSGGATGGNTGNTGTNTASTIRSIQTTLNSRYGAGLAVDGIWGPQSKRALIRALQIELNMTYGAGLTVDGIFGPRTKAAIRSVAQGSRGNIVWILQAGLFVKGFETTPDGIFGANTAAQVRAFQGANGLTVDGVAGPNTFEALLR